MCLPPVLCGGEMGVGRVGGEFPQQQGGGGTVGGGHPGGGLAVIWGALTLKVLSLKIFSFSKWVR